MSNINETIDQLIQNHDVVLFMKGTPTFPMCGFSSQVVQMLGACDATFHAVNVLDDDNMRQGIKVYSQWPTIPQLYIRGTFIGGCDIVSDLYAQGTLQQQLHGEAV